MSTAFSFYLCLANLERHVISFCRGLYVFERTPDCMERLDVQREGTRGWCVGGWKNDDCQARECRNRWAKFASLSETNRHADCVKSLVNSASDMASARFRSSSGVDWWEGE